MCLCLLVSCPDLLSYRADLFSVLYTVCIIRILFDAIIPSECTSAPFLDRSIVVPLMHCVYQDRMTKMKVGGFIMQERRGWVPVQTGGCDDWRKRTAEARLVGMMVLKLAPRPSDHNHTKKKNDCVLAVKRDTLLVSPTNGRP